MRIVVSPRQVAVTPGLSQRIDVTLTNTGTVIGGYAIRVLGADPGWIDFEPTTISLFPETAHTFSFEVTVPRGIPAGNRRIAVQVRELTPPMDATIAEVDLVVPAAPNVSVDCDPMAVTAGKRASFSLLVENTGNTELKGYLEGDDEQKKVTFTFTPERVTIPPGQHVVVDMKATAKRKFMGSPTVRMLDVYFDQLPENAFFDNAAVQLRRDPDASVATNATFIQRTVLARSALSLVGLLVAATVFAVVITIALSRLVGQTTADRNLALQVAAAANQPAATGTSGVAGTVTLLTSGKPVSGVAVSVFSASDTSVPVETTATDSKGTYSVHNLVAGKYYLGFRGAGFVQIFYPSATTTADATTITLAAGQLQGGLNVSLGGVPASIAGSVVGDDVSGATLFLETLPSGIAAVAAQDTLLPQDTTPGVVTPPDNGGAVVMHVPVGADGSFALTNVPSPSVYDLVVVKTGFATSTQEIDIGAGEARTGVVIRLSTGDGLISGTVTSPTAALSGVTISATSGQSTASTVSLSGTSAGQFTLRSLPTPATFTVVASAPGYAAQTLTLSLAAGQKLTGVAITLTQSAGSLKGMVTLLSSSQGIGGVTVTITNGVTTVQTATASSGTGAVIGSWNVGGLAVPGSYTVTFSRPDLQSQTVSVALDVSGNITQGSIGTHVTSAGITVAMQSSTATVAGTVSQPFGLRVCDAGDDLGEANVSMTTGASSYAVTTASVSPNCGMYELANIPPGTYTITVSAGTGTSPDSQVITVAAGEKVTHTVALLRAASITGQVYCPASVCSSKSVRTGWTVFLYLENQYPTVVAQTATTDGNGDYTFENVDAGRYVIAAGPTADPAAAINTVEVIVRPSIQTTSPDSDIETSQ
jgi:hypothetical protein